MINETIAKDIPVPKGKCRADSEQGKMRAIMCKLEVGDSFMVDLDVRKCYRAAQAVGITITTRCMEKGGFRVWRIK